MIIGFDIDDTITDTAKVLKKYAIEYNNAKEIKYNVNPNKWEFEKAYGWNKQNIIEFKEQYLEKIFNEVLPKPNCPNVIKKLKEEGNKIILITARGTEDGQAEINSMAIRKITTNWLDTYKINYDKLIVNCKDKIKACIDNNIEIYFDDLLYNCESISKTAKIPVYMYDCIYNSNEDIKNLKKVYSWDEIYNIIQMKS